MIRNQWYAVLDANEVKNGKLTGATRMNEKLVFWRDRNNLVHCIYDKCCHRGASLSLGNVKEDQVECPFHGLLYDSSGKVTKIPANGKNTPVPEHYNIHSYLVREQYGFIWLWYGENQDEAPETPFFEELKSGFSYSSFNEAWSVHYTRAIENQLDVMHLPFVHGTTIGRGNRTLVHGPVVKWKGNLMTFFVKNDADDGKTIPLKPSEIEDYKNLLSLQYLVPNIWQNRISDKIRVFAAFAPIDEENTMIYLRFYQKLLKFPVLKFIIGSLGNILNRIILHQDRRVVLTQLPKKTELKIGENLIQGDLPIVEFRKKRDELLKEGNKP